jgi:hypothetical protein
MSTGVSSFFFNNFSSSQEQLLLENLIIEAISIHGNDVYYIPRNINNLDKLYTEDDQSSYTNATLVAMYIETIDGFEGDGNFMSKFGLEIRDQVTFSISQRMFASEIGAYSGQIRPNEGDLIYFPLNKKCFQIKFVDKFEMFFQLGSLYTWKMTTELFEYSNEVINTGIPDIDSLQKQLSTNVLDWVITTESGSPITTEAGDFLAQEGYVLEHVLPNTENEELKTESDGIIDFSEVDPFSEGDV